MIVCRQQKEIQKLNRYPSAKAGYRFFVFILVIFSVVASPAWAASPRGEILRPVISIIMDDLGDTLETGREAIELPFPITYSILPHTPHSFELAQQAHNRDKEIFLHLPMEPATDAPMGPGGLTTVMSREEFVSTLRDNIAAVPFARGLNNHMGSLLTREPVQMSWLMEELRATGNMVFVDSYTTEESVAGAVARQFDIPVASRDVFLDHDRDFKNLAFYFEKMLDTARATGTAIGIAHPHRQTLAFLAQQLPRLAAEGIRIVPASELIEIERKRNHLWRVSLSPSPRVVKN